MNWLITLILGLLFIGMALNAILQHYGWLGLVVYFAVGALLWLDFLTKEHKRRRQQKLMTGEWWRDIA
jgi:hypothetical protein